MDGIQGAMTTQMNLFFDSDVDMREEEGKKGRNKIG